MLFSLRNTPVILLFGVLLLFPSSVLAQSSGKASLEGLKGVKVIVSVSDEAEEEGLLESTIKSNTELQLRKAEVNVFEDINIKKNPADPALSIIVSTSERDGVFSYTISLEVRQAVYTTNAVRTDAATYFVAGSVGSVGVDNVSDLTEPIEQKVRVFINDWLSVHEE